MGRVEKYRCASIVGQGFPIVEYKADCLNELDCSVEVTGSVALGSFLPEKGYSCYRATLGMGIT